MSVSLGWARERLPGDPPPGTAHSGIAPGAGRGAGEMRRSLQRDRHGSNVLWFLLALSFPVILGGCGRFEQAGFVDRTNWTRLGTIPVLRDVTLQARFGEDCGTRYQQLARGLLEKELKARGFGMKEDSPHVLQVAFDQPKTHAKGFTVVSRSVVVGLRAALIDRSTGETLMEGRADGILQDGDTNLFAFGNSRRREQALGMAVEKLGRQLAQLRIHRQEVNRPTGRVSKTGGPRSAWAVAVGLSSYRATKKPGLPQLAYAEEDAVAFCAKLKSWGWSNDHIKLLVDESATKRNVEIALESWLTKAKSDDLIVLFWSGHGFPDPEDPEKVYFACYDTDPNVPATGYRMDRVVQVLKERGARNVVVFADTCHAGKLVTKSGTKGISVQPYVEKIRREKSVPRGWIYMVAADADRKAVEHSSWKNGAFTHCLLSALSGKADGYQGVGKKDGVVNMLELRAFLMDQMPEQTQRVLGVAKHPLITTSSGDEGIWKLSLQP